MSYQVLARKWRPRNFSTLVGQEHVVRALTHALDQQRLHHAWLFTGTRGVGKTTLSRILAKALNCIGADGQGDITSQPCGVCQPCREIDAGRFVDYIEMDAASNRGIDEMVSLLEQAVYAPSSARFKVYMIDEVHMLTTQAFNAMLKTLEEPPEHVKFILATTDPQKIPVTVLSRCLQFNLKQMPPAQIITHLRHLLAEEQIPFEPAALPLLAASASGSMRDALSLTDQAIAYSAGHITEEAVRGMLGALDQTVLVRLLDALAAGDGAALVALADEIASRSLSFSGALQELGMLLHRIALAQTVPSAVTDDWPDANDVRRLAECFTPEDVQLHYQIVTHGRAELSLAPDEYAGFTMTLLRMLAFRPVEGNEDQSGRAPPGPASTDTRGMARAALSAASSRGVAATPSSRATPVQSPQRATVSAELNSSVAPNPEQRPAKSTLAQDPSPEAVVDVPAFEGDWLTLASQLPVTGLARQLVQQAELVTVEGDVWRLRVGIKTLLDGGTQERVRAALSSRLGRPVRLVVELGNVAGTTVAQVERDERAQRQSQAEAAIDNDPFVQSLVRDFNGRVIPGSVRPM